MNTKLKRNAITIRQRNLSGELNSRNIETGDVTVLSLARKSRMDCKNARIDCISTAQVR